MKTLVMIPLLMLATFASVETLAAPQDCSAPQLIAEHVKWLNASKDHVVRVTAVSNQGNRLVSYAEGELSITAQPFPGSGSTTYMGGTLEQYFNDRRYAMPAPGGVAVPRYPFAPKMTDRISLSIGSEATIGLSLKSWNNTVIKLTHVGCAGRVLYGFTNNSEGPRSFYLISMSKDTAAGAKQIR